MFGFRSKKNYPKFYRRYLEKIHDEGFSSDIIALYMETSGLNKKTTEVLSYGAVPILKNKIVPGEECHIFFESAKINNEAIVIHELLPETSQKKFSDYLPHIIGSIGNLQILGHFVSFDIGLINRELSRLKLPKLKNPSLDTLNLALKKDGISDLNYVRKEHYSLYALCERFNIEIQHTHDALEDAYLSALVYLHLSS